MFSSETGLLPKNTLRPRLLGAYKFNKKWTGYSGGELFLSYKYDQPMRATKFRYMVGVEHRLKKYHSIGLSYIYQQEIQVEDPLGQHITSVDYSLNLKKLVKKCFLTGPFLPVCLKKVMLKAPAIGR